MNAGERVVGSLATAGMFAGNMTAGNMLDCGVLTSCGVSCVDLTSDPQNCGTCGRTCVIPNATALCVDGQCQLGECAYSYLDVDQNLANGCEVFDDCVAGETCLSSCDTEGISECVNGTKSCLAPQESCNLLDDDCDGACDEDWQALGCRVGIHRGYGQGEHIYSE